MGSSTMAEHQQQWAAFTDIFEVKFLGRSLRIGDDGGPGGPYGNDGALAFVGNIEDAESQT
jgi:hypothetical protein